MIKNIILSIIYVYYNTPKEILDSIQSISDAIGHVPHEVIIVNNNSPKKIPPVLLKNKKIQIVSLKKNNGYGAGANAGVDAAKGKYLLIVNPDVKFHKNSITSMLKAMEKDKKIGLLGPLYLNKDGNRTPSVSGLPFLPGAVAAFSFIDKIFPKNPFSKKYWMRDINLGKEQKVPTIGGACMLFRREAFEKVSGFDEQFFMYFEEADISYRTKKVGYKVVYFPKAVITHLIGRSLSDKHSIQKTFEKSRFQFFKKYQGLPAALVGEGLIRYFTVENITLLFILSVSLFLNLYKLDVHMMFYGDFGRDLLAAREMLISSTIPLLGIPSSVVWLHQGPLSIYLMGIALYFGNFNPVAAAMFYALLGVASCYLVFKLGKEFFNDKVGLLSAAWYATSPIIVMNAREPYHTAPIPFFSLLFFITLWKVIRGDYRFVLFLFFLLGLLLQLELSNVVIVVFLLIIWWWYKLPISLKTVAQAIIGFSLGVLPFILYDVTHKFIQLGGLFLWTLNRIRLFFGITASGNSTTSEAAGATTTIWSELVRIIYPLSPALVIVILVSIVVVLFLHRKRIFQRKEKNPLLLLSLWFLVPVIGYTIHAKPGSAYFPVIYPAVILLLGFTLFEFCRRYTLLFAFIFIMIFFNAYYLLINNYFLATPASKTIPSLYGYSYGISYEVQKNAVDFIVSDAKDRPFAITGGGFLRDFKTSVDNYKYIALWKNGIVYEKARLRYTIHQQPKTDPQGNIVYKNQFITIVKNEQ